MPHSKGSHKKSNNPIVIIFRLFLSFIIFGVLVVGVYMAYRQFSGYDPLQLDVKTTIKNLLSEKALDTFLGLLSVGTSSPEHHSEEEGLQSLALPSKQPNTSPVLFKFTLIADSHNDNESLARAIGMVKEESKFIIGLGDYTDVGTIDELQKSKKVFDSAGLRYFLTAGDHDLWDSRDKGKEASENYAKVFGRPYQAFTYEGVRLIIIYNSDNYKGLGAEQKVWIKDELAKIKSDPEIKLALAFVQEPLYHPSSDHYMGKISPDIRSEAKELIKMLKDFGVKEVFAGDIHFFTRYTEPETGLSMTTLGAITQLRNTQTPRFGVVSVHQDYSYEIDDVEVR
jgi:hypothetical protein